MKNAKSFYVIALVLPAFLFFHAMVLPVRSETVHESDSGDAWFDSRWHYRLFVTVHAGDHDRNDYPVDMPVNFSGWIGINEAIDANSIRVLFNGTEIPSQYEPSTNKTGNVIFVINGSTVVGENKTFTVYFDTESNGLKPIPDYEDPDYVQNYKELMNLGKSLGSSPSNGTTDSWWFPSYLNYSDYDYSEWSVGDVKAVLNAWGDGWNGTDWIRHHTRATVYRDSYNAYVEMWSNSSDSEVSWASGLANISTGRPLGVNNASKDRGLHVITSEWTVENVSAIDYGCCPVLASGSIDTYNHLLNKTFTFTFQSGDTSTKRIEPQSDRIPSINTVVNLTNGNNSLVDSSDYTKVDDPNGDQIQFAFPAVEGESFEVNYTTKKYDWDDELRVCAKNGSMEYLIMYDSDDLSGTPYVNPQIGALIFPQPVAASNMVVEFWENRSLRAPGDALFDYYLNISTNYKEWWYNTTNSSLEYLHEPQYNSFTFIASYMNGSVNPEQEVVDLIDSVNNPVNITVIEEESTPVGVMINDPSDGDFFNAWYDIPNNPKVSTITIDADITGDTVARSYYKIGASGVEIDFNGTGSVPVGDFHNEAFDGSVFLFVGVEDTNGTVIEDSVMIYVPFMFWQHLFGTIGGLAVVIVTIITGFLAIFGIALIKNKVGKGRSGKNSFIAS